MEDFTPTPVHPTVLMEDFTLTTPIHPTVLMEAFTLTTPVHPTVLMENFTLTAPAPMEAPTPYASAPMWD